MGRKRTNFEEKSHLDLPKEKEVEPEGLNPLQTVEMEKQPDYANSSVERVNSRPVKLMNTAKSASLRKKIKSHITAVRRSNRIQNTIVNAPIQNTQPVIPRINISESEKEDEQDAGMEEEELPNSTSVEKSIIEEKMDYISKLLEAQRKNMETLMSKGLKMDSTSDSPNMRYKSLYIQSQRKIETLTKENNELSVKLDVALAKLEGFEKGTCVSSEWMQSLKELTMISNFTQAIRNGLSSQDADVQEPIIAVKRKKGQR
ncbi:hypothetical protein PanWU01x14_189710 [Parasponia andersonii]|uniref:Uncharacterized protein n=1 Tax=Parasponia andersonii TaxID=3476 RepID=A0A2P5C2K3_PARAD|nr:hypothetical protein PanWU01x14_189710 [Parasponia andersonii]